MKFLVISLSLSESHATSSLLFIADVEGYNNVGVKCLAFGGRRSEEQDKLSLLIGTRHLNLWQNFRELQFVYIIIEIMYWKSHVAGFKAIPHYCSAQPKEVRDQRHCPGLVMSTAGLSVRPSVSLPVQPGLLWLVPGPRDAGLSGG